MNANDTHILVVRIEDDHADPFIGEVVGWTDEETCLVLWGDERFAEFPSEPRHEYADELTTYRPRR
jgi:hypothetical protein